VKEDCVGIVEKRRGKKMEIVNVNKKTKTWGLKIIVVLVEMILYEWMF
tara:strand:- start:70 stop:213 length:144 start_codon:yes stop_codon:yes gene_type:complete